MTTKTPLDRRGFMRIAGRYGLSSTMLAAVGMFGPLTLEGVGQAAAQTANNRSGKAKYNFKMGSAGFNDENLKIQESGQLWVARALYNRSDGAIRVAFIGSNQFSYHLVLSRTAQPGISTLY